MQLHLSLDPDPVIVRIRDRLRGAFGSVLAFKRRDPVSQLVRSMLGARTYDAVSEAVFAVLRARFRPWSKLAEARVDEVAPLVAPVTYAADKAPRLIAALAQVKREVGGVRLDFLEPWPLEQAMAWLQTLPGVGQKVAASVLNFSTLKRRVFVVDGHILRVAERLELIAPRDDAATCRESVMDAAPDDWQAEDFTELHILMKRLGQVFCVFGRPDCGGCPLRGICPHAPPPELTLEPELVLSPATMEASHTPEAANENKQATSGADPLRDYLRRRIARLTERGVSLEEMRRAAVSLGQKALDAAFVERGLAPGLHQSAGARPEDGAAAFVLPLAAVLSGRPPARQARLLVVQESDARRESGDLFGPGLEALGLKPAEAAFVRVRDGPQALQAADEAVRSRAAPSVLVELRRGAGLADLSLTRRFNMAARRAGLFVHLVTPDLSGTSAAATRWRIASAPSRGLRRRFGPPAFDLDLVRNRHGSIGRWLVEWSARERRFLSARPLTDAGCESWDDDALSAFPAPVDAAAFQRPGAG